MSERERSENNDVRADVEVLPRISPQEVLEVSDVVGRYETVSPRCCKPAGQRVKNAGAERNNLIRKGGAFQEAVDDQSMRPMGGDVERD